MSLTVRPDPQRRFGGAIIQLGQPVNAAEVTVALTRLHDGQQLGANGWQGADHAFGPYPVEADEAGPMIRIGPEIVNQLDPFEGIRLSVSALEQPADLRWPETVRPKPRTALSGKVVGPARTAPKASDTYAQPEPEPEPADIAGPGYEEKTAAFTGPDDDEVRPHMVVDPVTPAATPRRPWRVVVPVLLLLVLIAAAGWYWYDRYAPTVEVITEDTEDGPGDTEIVEEDATEGTSDEDIAIIGDDEETATVGGQSEVAALACERPSIDQAGDIEGLWQVFRVCADAGDTRIQSEVLDWLVASGDADALLQYAREYDPHTEAVRYFGFRPDVGVALRYYSRAEAAGSETGADGKQLLCQNVRDAADFVETAMAGPYCEDQQ